MTRLRNDNLVLVYGDYDLILNDHNQIYANTRALNNDRMLVLLNFSGTEASAQLPESFDIGNTLINNYELLL